MINVLIFIILLIIAAVIVVKLTFAVLRWMAMNAVVGLILLGVLNYLGVAHIEINLINFLIVAVGGILGVFLLLFLSYL
ncbi:pro-sigmaK processing inhibitor BofA family protein [Thermococcus argininiproducens]|uniref:Pro-sigmaK processing inhibitor BofA family protein n=1 Tax=Thermococcus argininiproducens TaxID=2866384 RepID=A0A9E7MAS8_9EURY|nr:pro-sigmaK processing inhibitor BofA family protein [Thermococcus argininiproducens]USH00344.1 pro-sigmaK processing inhibitor BofA family protein [Thermococcus argininiproducens]